jgi:hypothetical protein
MIAVHGFVLKRFSAYCAFVFLSFVCYLFVTIIEIPNAQFPYIACQ